MKNIAKIGLLIGVLLLLFSCETVNAQIDYTYTFESNGGSLIESINQDELPSSIPVKDGFIFGGWYLDETLYYPAAFNTVLTKDITLYAKWIEVKDELTIEDIETMLLNYQNEDIDLLDLIGEYENHVTTMLNNVSKNDYAGGGSGVIYKKTDNYYYILTNEHVINGYENLEFEITLFGDTTDTLIYDSNIEVLYSSVKYDLAIMKFYSTKTFFVFAIGSPLDLPNTKSFGMISMVSRLMVDGYGMDALTIQHTASINPGNSGGALVDIYGKLVGINTMSYVDEFVGEGINGLFFAVQIDEIEKIIEGIS